jgi:hypothetical protein
MNQKAKDKLVLNALREILEETYLKGIYDHRFEDIKHKAKFAIKIIEDDTGIDN